MNAFSKYMQIPSDAQAYMIQGMSNADYHARPEFSSSQLKDVLISSAHFYVRNISKEVVREEKAHLNLGSLVHTLLIEPELFADEFAILLKFDRRTKAGKEAAEEFAAQNLGKILISQDDFEKATRMATNLANLGTYKEALQYGVVREASIIFIDPIFDLELRVRPDMHVAPCVAYPYGLIFEVKSANDSRPKAFSKKCHDYGYDLSAAMYREAFQIYYKTIQKPPVVFLVVDSETPFCVKQYQASEAFLACGDARYHYAKMKIKEATLLDAWPGYSTELEEIDLPLYATNQILK